ncbi:4,5:9,10-diseco-3-hydroxy-5,9, 17-trioxoandrosta-1(10),2-diene-4-oate hydrolase [bacterium HR30]|nr:4,5:9,10-diseco-3-hydroxy-5,9, 17-trioxoandrosta-1(10),2-diene-4-oate hydrolase [bacterium HR30]
MTEKIMVCGETVELRRKGSGAPLLYLHGGIGDTDWLPVFDDWASRFSVVQALHPGFGGSTGGEKLDGVEDLVFHYLDLLAHLGWDQGALTIVGASFGGWIAAEIAARYPKLVSHLMLVGAAGLWIDDSPPAELFGREPRELAALLFHKLDHPVAAMMAAVTDVASLPEDLILQQFKAMEALARVAWNPYFHDPKLERLLPRVRAKTAIVWGAEDRFFPPVYAQRYASAIPSAQLCLVEGAGHLVLLERPEEVTRQLIKLTT